MTSNQKQSWWRRALKSVYTATFPFHHWMVSSQSLVYLDDLNQSQWLPSQKIKEYQERRLRQLIAHIYYRTHYYRDVFDALGITVEDIKTIEDLQKLPIIDKKVVRENLYLGLMSNNHDKRLLQKATTSGSTGEPFFTFIEKQQVEMLFAATLRGMNWAGWNFGDRQLRLWHKHLGLTWHQVLRERVDALLTRRSFIPAYEMDEQGLEDFMAAIDRARPMLIDGYAESFNFIAKYLKHKQYTGHKPAAIVCSGQMLPEESRRIIEDTFGCKVYDKYGAREFGGGLAYECDAHEGHHVVAECVIIEVVKDGRLARPGEIGEVVVTDLNNYAAPLIRYRLGDLAVAMDSKEVCACGRGLPRIGKIEGRIQAVVIGANGTVVPGTFFSRLFADYDHAIRQFQFVQEQPGTLTLKIVKAPLFEPRTLEPILAELRRHLGAETKIQVEFVEHIGLGRTGKRQYSVSRVTIDEILQKVHRA